MRGCILNRGGRKGVNFPCTADAEAYDLPGVVDLGGKDQIQRLAPTTSEFRSIIFPFCQR